MQRVKKDSLLLKGQQNNKEWLDSFIEICCYIANLYLKNQELFSWKLIEQIKWKWGRERK